MEKSCLSPTVTETVELEPEFKTMFILQVYGSSPSWPFGCYLVFTEKCIEEVTYLSFTDSRIK